VNDGFVHGQQKTRSWRVFSFYVLIPRRNLCGYVENLVVPVEEQRDELLHARVVLDHSLNVAFVEQFFGSSVNKKPAHAGFLS
jgi:hypothetical protein